MLAADSSKAIIRQLPDELFGFPKALEASRGKVYYFPSTMPDLLLSPPNGYWAS